MRRSLGALLGLAALALSGAAEAPTPVRLEVVLAEAPAPRLSDYGLFQDAAARSPSPGVTPYDLNTPLFSDYAAKHRFIFTPDGQSATYRPDGPLEFPVGTVLVNAVATSLEDSKATDKTVGAVRDLVAELAGGLQRARS